MKLGSPEAQIVLAVGRWWTKHEVGKWLSSKEHRQARRQAKKDAARREAEAAGGEYLYEDEDKIMLRTSTGAGLAGIAVNILIQVLQAFPATAELATPEVAAALTTLAMWAVARVWKTPAAPGKI